MNKETFKKIRKDNGYTQLALSEVIGLTEQMISYMENGHKEISKRTAIAMRNIPRRVE